MATPDLASVVSDASQCGMPASPADAASQARPNNSLVPSPPFAEFLSQIGPPTATSVPQLLARALDLPSRAPWLHDFLFESNVSADIAMLSSPVALSSSCTAHVSDTSMEISGALSGALDTAVQVDWALVPAFCAGGVTCGAVVTSLRVSAAGPSVERTKAEKSVGRFLRDESTAEFLLFKTDANDEAGPVCSMLHMTHESSTTRKRTYIRFRKPSCGAPSAAAILFASSSTEKRWCPLCGKSPNAMCPCSLQFVMPRHPLDFTSHCNMESHVGSFLGNSRYSLLYGPFAGRTVDMLSRCNVVGGCDKATIKALAGWAVQDRLGGLAPQKGLFMPSEMTPGELSIPAASATCSVLGTPEAVALAVPNPSPLGAVLDLPSADSAACALDLALSGFSDLTDLAAPPNVLDADSSAPFFPFFQGGGSGSSSSRKSSVLPEIGTVAADANFGVLGAKLPVPVQTEKEVDKEEADRMARKHRRKLRNREAAARSNKKRKENYENLQKNVLDIRQRKEMLTKRLEVLKAENAALKMRAPNVAPSVSTSRSLPK